LKSYIVGNENFTRDPTMHGNVSFGFVETIIVSFHIRLLDKMTKLCIKMELLFWKF